MEYLPRMRPQTFVYRDVPAEELRIPLTQAIYVGDGESDIPCFSLLNQEQGTAIALYKGSSTPKEWGREVNLTQSQRVANLTPVDYSENSELVRVVADPELDVGRRTFERTDEVRLDAEDLGIPVFCGRDVVGEKVGCGESSQHFGSFSVRSGCLAFEDICNLSS